MCKKYLRSTCFIDGLRLLQFVKLSAIESLLVTALSRRQNTLRYNALCKMMNKLAAAACFGPGSYKIVEGGVDHL
jgi:hypothetical protein